MKKTYATTFNPDIAKKAGLDEAVVHEWILNQMTVHALRKDELNKLEDVWWVLLSREMLVGVFPFWTENQIGRILSNLVKKELLREREASLAGFNWYSAITKEPTPKQKKERQKKDNAPVSDRVFEFYKIHEDGTKEPVRWSLGQLVSDLINEFKNFNPNYEMFFSRPVQRKALERMADKYSPTQLYTLLRHIPQTNQMQYAPVITTPLEFERSAPKLIAFIQRKITEGNSQMAKVSL